MDNISNKRVSFCRKMARKLLKEYSVIALPVPVEKIAEANGFIVKELDFDDSISGRLIREKKAIGINKNHALVRRRFSMAHELGHYFLEHPDESSYFDYKEQRKIYDSEANEFAAELLMPLNLLKEEYSRNRDLDALAKIFLVSKEALTIKMLNSGLIR